MVGSTTNASRYILVGDASVTLEKGVDQSEQGAHMLGAYRASGIAVYRWRRDD
jgi:hypothetical protein